MEPFPKVIGFIPTYKSEQFILKTLEALAAQTYPNFEIIIGDDASPDQTYSVCEEFCRSDARFRLIRNEKNLGWFDSSENLWLQSAKGSKYCFCNPHDDLPYPDFISELVTLMEKNPVASLAIPGMENEYWDQTISSFYTQASNLDDAVERCMTIIRKDQHHWWAAFHGMHRSEVVSKIFPVGKLAFGEKEFSLDLIIMLKMAFYGSFVTSDRILFKKVYLKNSVSNRWKHNKINKAALWVATLKEIKNAPLSGLQKKDLNRRLYALLATRVSNRVSSLFN